MVLGSCLCWEVPDLWLSSGEKTLKGAKHNVILLEQYDIVSIVLSIVL